MLDKEIQQKVRACKALQDMSVAQLVATDRFLNNLGAYMAAQSEDRKAIRKSYDAMRKLGGTKGYKLPAHAIDRVIDMSVEEFAKEYLAIIGHTSTCSAAEREYIYQLGTQAYELTVAQYVVDEFPELKEELIPSAKNAN